MNNSLLVVEGIHDATFFGVLLKEIGYSKLDDLEKVPELWRHLIPTTFPSKGKLEHVVHYPDIFLSSDANSSIAIVVGKSLSEIKNELKAAIAILPLDELKAIGLCLDADEDPGKSFTCAQEIYADLNDWALREGVFKEALTVPASAEKFSDSYIRLGVFVSPNNSDQGALETTLIRLAADRYPTLNEASAEFVKRVDGHHANPHKDLKQFRKGGNVHKSHVGVISNILRPGSSLAVAIDQCEWVPADHHVALAEIRAFVKQLI